MHCVCVSILYIRRPTAVNRRWPSDERWSTRTETYTHSRPRGAARREQQPLTIRPFPNPFLRAYTHDFSDVRAPRGKTALGQEA